MKCDHCGAPITDVGTNAGAFCSHCGTRVARPEPAAARSSAATEHARFDLATASDGYAAAARHSPAPPALTGIVTPLVMGVFVAGFLVVSVSMMSGFGGAPLPFAALFLAVPALALTLACRAFWKALRFTQAPIQREVLVVVDERIEVSGGGEDSSARTSYYASLQSRDGARIEYKTYGWLAGRIAPGDIGVAFLKDRTLIDFVRLEG